MLTRKFLINVNWISLGIGLFSAGVSGVFLGYVPNLTWFGIISSVVSLVVLYKRK